MFDLQSRLFLIQKWQENVLYSMLKFTIRFIIITIKCGPLS